MGINIATFIAENGILYYNLGVISSRDLDKSIISGLYLNSLREITPKALIKKYNDQQKNVMNFIYVIPSHKTM